MATDKPDSLASWDEVDMVEVSTAELDAKIKQMQEEWAEYERLKAVASEQHEKYENTERYILGLLKAAKKTKYYVEGLGTASIRNRYVVRTPKSLVEKQALFNYIKDKHGPDALMGLVSINHQSLNSFVNAEKETNPVVEIPGLEAPTHEESLSFRSERK